MNFKNMSVAKIVALIGTVASLVSILTFGGDVARYVETKIVTDKELAVSEKRIIDKIESEAVLTRSVFIAQLIERKTELNIKLENAETLGEIQRIQNEISTIAKRIETLRGTH